MNFSPSVTHGIRAGLFLALAVSLISIGAMRWAWDKKFFYWVWGGGIFFRMAVFAGCAFVVYQYTSLNLAATLLTLAVATTIFLVVESAVFLKKK